MGDTAAAVARPAPAAWRGALVLFVCVRVGLPLLVLAFTGRDLPGVPRYDFVALTGDATGYYAAAREFMASWGRLHPALVALLGLALVAVGMVVARGWRRPERRPWLVAGSALALAGVIAAGVSQMQPAGSAVFGWPLVWSLPMLPYRALGLPLDPEVAFGFGLVLSLAANAVTVVAVAYAGLYATGKRGVGLAAAGLFAFWPLLTRPLGGDRAWENGTWTVDTGLHLYTEPLSTALVTVALALLLRPGHRPLVFAVAGVALSLAATVKLSNGLLAALALGLLVWRFGVRRSAPFAAGALSFVPVLVAYWQLGYPRHFDNPSSWPRDPFALGHVDRAWGESLLFTPRLLLVLVPLALIGTLAVRRGLPLAALAAWILVNPLFYSFYANTAEHPRFLFASLPPLFVLVAAGAGVVAVTAIGAWASVRPAKRPAPHGIPRASR